MASGASVPRGQSREIAPVTTRERRLHQREGSVMLHELAGVTARRILPGGTTPRVTKGVSLFPADVQQSQVRLFEKAGWRFYPSDAEPPEGDTVQVPVFVREEGRLALAPRSLVVEFPADLSNEQANQRLARFGCRVLEPLRFSPGLFRVGLLPEVEGDTIEVVNRMVESGEFAAVEPEWIECIGGR